MPLGTDTKTITQECQVVVFAWDQRAEEGVSESALGDATAFDISNYISQVSMSKSMDAPAGQFQIMLPNDRDWKEVIKKGYWLIIYCANDGSLSIPNRNNQVAVGNTTVDAVSMGDLTQQKDKIRMIGRVDTVRAQGRMGQERGDFDVQFVVSGRNYGVVYEETEIWHNQVLYDSTLLETTNATINSNAIKTVDGLLEALHNLFFAPDKLTSQLNKEGSLTSIARQWMLPQKLFGALNISPDNGTPYYGNIPNVLNLGNTPATYPVESPTALLNGVAWERLKAHSIEPYHELFVELNDDGEPRLNFRLMPWVVNRRAVTNFPLLFASAGENLLYGKEVNGQVLIEDIDIMEWDLGEDDHTRYNLFWSSINTSMVSTMTSNAVLGDNSPTTGFPRINQNSIRRHGLRKLLSEVNANIIIGKEESDPDLLRQFNEYALELWERSHEYESGTLTLIGNNSIRLGKTVRFEQDSPYNSDKIFYIEGYEETFNVGEKGQAEWTQSLFLTRGIERPVLENSLLITERQAPHTNAGEFTDKS